MDDVERGELGEERKKRTMSIQDILQCPTWDCDGGPEVWSTGVRTSEGEIWCVGCPKCKGWNSQFLIKEGQDPYTAGIDAWMEMRKEMGR